MDLHVPSHPKYDIKFWEELSTYFPSYDMDHIENERIEGDKRITHCLATIRRDIQIAK
jgi:hypothetical protein